jgi:hypothetical protein
VSLSFKVNLTSLNMIKPELLASIRQSSSNIEAFISNRDKAEFLQSSLDGLKEILGILQLIQLRGADMLVQEMIELASVIPAGTNEKYDKPLSVLSTGFFILPRYFEYSQQTEQCMPVLLLPFVNDIRIANNKAPLSDGQFFSVRVTAERPTPPKAEAIPPAAEFATFVRRMRQMYLVGLLGILLDKRVNSSFGLMQRAMTRLDRYTSNKPMGKLWWLMGIALEVMEKQKMSVTAPRKFLFTAVDRQLKQLQKKGAAILEQQAAEAILKELIYIIAVSGANLPSVKQVRQAFGVPPMPFTEAQLVQEMENLRGPEMGTVHSVAEVIREELRDSKNSLEVLSMGGADIIAGYKGVADSLQRVADILSVVGLLSASTNLREQIALFRKWEGQKHEADRQELLAAADVLLYVESTITALEKINLSPEKLAKVNALAKDDVIASGQVADAEKVVLEEAQAGLALIKRGIMSFQESNFDKNHIANLGKSLSAVRGAMIMLNMNRAAEIAGSCAKFVDNTLMKGEVNGAIQQILETFADAIISLEYYLDNYIQVGVKDESVLEIAAESVHVLGVPVEKH